MKKLTKCAVFTSGLRGAEESFGLEAARWGQDECVLTFAGQHVTRLDAKQIVVLSEAELQRGDISMEIVSSAMRRTYYATDKIRRVLQTLFHVVNRGHQVLVVGTIMEDNTAKGGTGWAVELAKLFNRPLSVFDQQRGKWYGWHTGIWQEERPEICHPTLACSGTRNLNEAGRQAIAELFASAFGGK